MQVAGALQPPPEPGALFINNPSTRPGQSAQVRTAAGRLPGPARAGEGSRRPSLPFTRDSPLRG